MMGLFASRALAKVAGPATHSEHIGVQRAERVTHEPRAAVADELCIQLVPKTVYFALCLGPDFGNTRSVALVYPALGIEADDQCAL
jgi:hypothetical protein